MTGHLEPARLERLLELFDDMPHVKILLGPPRFCMPPEVADALGLPICDDCAKAIDPAAHGLVRWGDKELHASCAHDLLLAADVAIAA